MIGRDTYWPDKNCACACGGATWSPSVFHRCGTGRPMATRSRKACTRESSRPTDRRAGGLTVPVRTRNECRLHASHQLCEGIETRVYSNPPQSRPPRFRNGRPWMGVEVSFCEDVLQRAAQHAVVYAPVIDLFSIAVIRINYQYLLAAQWSLRTLESRESRRV